MLQSTPALGVMLPVASPRCWAHSPCHHPNTLQGFHRLSEAVKPAGLPAGLRAAAPGQGLVPAGINQEPESITGLSVLL